MINPEQRFLVYWNLFILGISIYTAIEIPLVLVYQITEGALLETLNWLTTIIFMADIVINFYTADYKKGKVITDHRFIAKKYLKTWFTIDLLAALPFSFIFHAFFGLAKFLTFGRLLKLFRLFRLIKLVRITGIFQKSGRSRINPAILRLFILVFWIILVAHFITCIWISLSGVDTNLDPVSKYIRAFYWTITTLTTIGYGDITPSGNVQTIFVIIIELAGAAMYGLIIGNIANLIANIDIAKTQFKEKMKIINTFLKYRNIPGAMQKKVNMYYNYLWESRRGYDEAHILEDLPLPLQTSISLFLNREIIEKVPLFEGASDELKKEIILNLVPVVFTPHDNIVTAGEVGNDMYFLSKGSVDVLSGDETRHFATLREGQFFGEIALLLQTPRTATIKAREFCDLFRLDKDTFDRILKKYPSFEKSVRKLAEERKQELELDTSTTTANDIKKNVPHRKIEDIKIVVRQKTIGLSWQAIPGALAYEIIMKDTLSEKWEYVAKNLHKPVYTELTTKTKQRRLYRVRAVYPGGKGPWSDTILSK